MRGREKQSAQDAEHQCNRSDVVLTSVAQDERELYAKKCTHILNMLRNALDLTEDVFDMRYN